MNETEEKRDEAKGPEEPACGIPEEAPEIGRAHV